MIKKKGLKAIVISLLIILSATCFSLLYTNIYKTFTAAQPQAATSYNFANGAISKDSYDEYTIGNLTALQNFASSANNGITFYDDTNKKAKIVKLTADIVGNNANIGINSFAGIFDGNFYTISGFTLTGYYHNIISGKQGVKHGYHAVGFIGNLASTGLVENLRLFNVTATSIMEGTTTLDNMVFGGVVGFADNNSTIKDCIVENFSTLTNDYVGIGDFSGYSATITAGILGAGNSEISYCYTEGIMAEYKPNEATVNTIPFICGIGPVASQLQSQNTHAFDSSNVSITNCVAKNTDNYFYGISYKNEETIEGSKCYTHNTGDDFKNLGSIGSTGGITGTTWYYISGYNDNWPYLRQFINWGTIYFNTDNNSSYDTTHTYPSDFINTVATNWVDTQLNWSGIVLPGAVNVTASNNIAGKDFDGWKKDSTYHYSATYLDDEYGVAFWRPQYNGSYIDCSVTYKGTTTPLNETTYSLKAESRVKYGNSVSVSYLSTANTITYTIGSITATYTIPAMYELDNYGTLGLDGPQIINGMSVPDYSNLINLLIIPQLKLKEINLTFPIVDYTTRTGSEKYTVDYGTIITVTQTNAECSYKFGTTTVKYMVTNSDLYRIINANLNNNFTVTESKTIQPSAEQYAIYVQFTNTIGDYAATPSRTDQFTIAYNANADEHYTITNTMPDNLTNNKTLTYTLNGSTTVTYTIPAIYVLEDAGIHATDTKITITPQLQEKYMLVIFKQNNTEIKRAKMDKGTDVSSVEGYNKGWDAASSTLYLKYTKDGVQQVESFTFVISREQYFEKWEQKIETNTETGKDEKIVIITITIKTYGIIFG